MNIIRVRTNVIVTHDERSEGCYIEPLRCSIDRGITFRMGSTSPYVYVLVLVGSCAIVRTTFGKEVPVVETFWGDVE